MRWLRYPIWKCRSKLRAATTSRCLKRPPSKQYNQLESALNSMICAIIENIDSELFMIGGEQM